VAGGWSKWLNFQASTRRCARSRATPAAVHSPRPVAVGTPSSFNAYAELGGGLQIIAPDVIRGVQGATVRASAIAGPGVTGWLVSAALNF
jgi:hypothetical protein